MPFEWGFMWSLHLEHGFGQNKRDIWTFNNEEWLQGQRMGMKWRGKDREWAWNGEERTENGHEMERKGQRMGMKWKGKDKNGHEMERKGQRMAMKWKEKDREWPWNGKERTENGHEMERKGQRMAMKWNGKDREWPWNGEERTENGHSVFLKLFSDRISCF